MKGKKTGGRKAGTPNKTSMTTKAGIMRLFDVYLNGDPSIEIEPAREGQLMRDFYNLKGKDRLFLLKDMLPFVLPKMQSVSMDLDEGENTRSLKNKLAALSAGRTPVKGQDEDV